MAQAVKTEAADVPPDAGKEEVMPAKKEEQPSEPAQDAAEDQKKGKRKGRPAGTKNVPKKVS